jgi:RNA polymerase sigma-70 factor (ECF subfamily)
MLYIRKKMIGEESLLIESAKKGDPKALNDIFAKEQRYIFNLMIQLTGDPAQADDLAQETFLVAYQNLNKFRLQSSLRTWLSKIAINLFRREYKRRPKHVSICLDEIKMPSEEDRPERIVIKKELQWCILHSLQQHVPKKYREVLILRDLQNLSYREISEILSWSMGKIKTCIHRGRKILRAHFINGKCKAFAEKDYLCICEGILEL